MNKKVGVRNKEAMKKLLKVYPFLPRRNTWFLFTLNFNFLFLHTLSNTIENHGRHSIYSTTSNVLYAEIVRVKKHSFLIRVNHFDSSTLFLHYPSFYILIHMRKSQIFTLNFCCMEPFHLNFFHQNRVTK